MVLCRLLIWPTLPLYTVTGVLAFRGWCRQVRLLLEAFPLRQEAAPEASTVLYDGVADHPKQEGGICAPVYPCLAAVKNKSAALHACTAACSQTGLAAESPYNNSSTSKLLCHETLPSRNNLSII